jgi:hypothetical protein
VSCQIELSRFCAFAEKFGRALTLSRSDVEMLRERKVGGPKKRRSAKQGVGSNFRKARFMVELTTVTILLMANKPSIYLHRGFQQQIEGCERFHRRRQGRRRAPHRQVLH